MTWRHLWLPAPRYREAPDLVDDSRPTAVYFHGGSATILMAALSGAWRQPLIPWLKVTSGYPSTLVARDLATLAHLVDVPAVVLSSDDELVDEHAEIVALLLSGEVVNLQRDLHSLHGAISRPAPPKEISVWVSGANAVDSRAVFFQRFLGASAVGRDDNASVLSTRISHESYLAPEDDATESM